MGTPATMFSGCRATLYRWLISRDRGNRLVFEEFLKILGQLICSVNQLGIEAVLNYVTAPTVMINLIYMICSF